VNYAKDISGKRYGWLTVKGQSAKIGWWICECDCGGLKRVKRCHLIDGDTKSCGCLHRQGNLKYDVPIPGGAGNRKLRQAEADKRFRAKFTAEYTSP
jgi:hypothetical protein